MSYSEKLGKLSYMASAAIGVQNFTADRSALFASSDALQNALQARAPFFQNLQTSYAGRTVTGVSGSLHGEIQYELLPDLGIGGALDFERAGDFNQGAGLFYARYKFSGPGR